MSERQADRPDKPLNPGGGGSSSDTVHVARINRQGVIAGALIAALSAVLVGFISNSKDDTPSRPTGSATSAPTATEAPRATVTVPPLASTAASFVSPEDGDRVPQVITASGTAVGVRPGHQLWLFVQAQPDGRLFPVAVTQSGTDWTALDLYVGGEDQAALPFRLHLAELDTTAQHDLDGTSR